MRRPSNLLFCAALLLTTLMVNTACDATIGSDDEIGDDTSSTGDGDTGGCTNDEDCAEGQYCNDESQLCQTQTVFTCSDDDDCSEGQICINQFCSSPSVDTDCEPGVFMDGCPSDAICLANPDPESEEAACYTMPACAADDTCPVGVHGALCNTGYLPDKDEICMLGACDTLANCPENWFCVRYAENDPFGICGGGGFGDPCATADQCLSGMCFIPIPGLGGFCQQ